MSVFNMFSEAKYFVLPLRELRAFKRTFSSNHAPKEKTIKINNIKINYVKLGNGPHTLLCLPGALGTIWTHFRPQVEGLDRTHFTVVAWDPPGYGNSRPPEKEFTTDFYDRDVETASQFMEALNVPKYSVLGWSDGGITGMMLAARQPARVRRLVVVGSNSYMLPHELDRLIKMRDVKTWSNSMRKPMIEMYGETVYAKLWAAWVDGMAYMFDVRGGEICSRVLKDIKCPTYILFGGQDPIVDKAHAHYLHENIRGSRMHLYPDGRHNVHLAYPEDFNTRVQQFLLD